MIDAGILDADYEALRHGAGAVRTSRHLRYASGRDALSFLQSQCSQDVAAIEVGGSADSLLLSPEGKVDALIRVTRESEDAFVLDFEGSDEDVMARLKRFKLRAKVEFEPLEWEVIALRGPRSRAPEANLPVLPNPRVVPFEWNGLSGFDLLGPADEFEVEPATRWCRPEALEACRIEAGIPAMGKELDQKTIAAEAWLVERSVSFTKGCFTGQELVARLDARGTNVVRRLCGLRLEEEMDPQSLLGAAVHAKGAEKAVGNVTSAAWCPGLGAVGALTYLHRSVAVGEPLEIEVPGSATRFPAESRDLPMV